MANNDNGTELSDADRLVLSAVMDLIVPAVDELPGAGEMGLADAAEEFAGKEGKYGVALARVMDALSLEPSARAEGGFAALDEEQRTRGVAGIGSEHAGVFRRFCGSGVYRLLQR